jgi:hypothetical protein
MSRQRGKGMRQNRGVTALVREIIPKLYDAYGAMNARMYYYFLTAKAGDGEPIIADSHSNSNIVNLVLVELRKNGSLPWSAVLDDVRTFNDPFAVGESSPALDLSFQLDQIRAYAKPPTSFIRRWERQPLFPIIIVEKIGMDAWFGPVASHWCTPLYCLRGQGGVGHLHEVIVPYLKNIAESEWRPEICPLYFGDGDKPGLDIERNFNKELLEMGLSCQTKRVAMTPKQLSDMEGLKLDSLLKASKEIGSPGWLEEARARVDWIKELCSKAIEECWDEEIHNANTQLVKKRNAYLRRIWPRKLQQFIDELAGE